MAIMTAKQLIEMSRRENRTVAEYPETDAGARELLESLGAYASDDCAVWDHQSGAGYSGSESVGRYEVFGDADDDGGAWRVDVIYSDLG